MTTAACRCPRARCHPACGRRCGGARTRGRGMRVCAQGRRRRCAGGCLVRRPCTSSSAGRRSVSRGSGVVLARCPACFAARPALHPSPPLLRPPRPTPNSRVCCKRVLEMHKREAAGVRCVVGVPGDGQLRDLSKLGKQGPQAVGVGEALQVGGWRRSQVGRASKAGQARAQQQARCMSAHNAGRQAGRHARPALPAAQAAAPHPATRPPC